MSCKDDFNRTIIEADLGVTAMSVMSDCMKYGMIGGCDENCPVFQIGECEVQSEVEEMIKNGEV